MKIHCYDEGLDRETLSSEGNFNLHMVIHRIFKLRLLPRTKHQMVHFLVTKLDRKTDLNIKWSIQLYILVTYLAGIQMFQRI